MPEDNNPRDIIQNARESLSDPQEAAQNVKEVAKGADQKAKAAAPDPQEAIQSAKEALPDVTPKPPGIRAQAPAQDLKARLEGGEQALTIIDVSDRATYNNAHIMGAIPVPIDQLVETAKQSRIEPSRDVYIYGETDEQTAKAANTLREAGWQNVAELQGGLAAWKQIAGSTEGIEEAQAPPEGGVGYNVVDTVKHALEKKSENP